MNWWNRGVDLGQYHLERYSEPARVAHEGKMFRGFWLFLLFLLLFPGLLWLFGFRP